MDDLVRVTVLAPCFSGEGPILITLPVSQAYAEDHLALLST